MCKNTAFGMHDYGEYTKLISSQISDMEVGEVRQVDAHKESREKFRSTVRHVAIKNSMKFATRFVRNEGFYVKRKA